MPASFHGARLPTLWYRMAGSDCELIGAGWLAQPANAWSSGAYLVAAAFVLARRHRAGAASLAVVAGAVALGLVSLGSIAYHGPQPPWAEAAHDWSIAALLLALVVRGAVDRPSFELHRIYLVGAGALAAATALVLAAPFSTQLVHGSLAVALVVSEAGRRRDPSAKPGVAHRVALAAVGSGLLLYLLGRTGGPLCSPASPFQAHAGWHVLTAVAAAAALSSSTTTQPPNGTPRA